MSQHPIEKLWREHDLPEWFLGNGGTNTKLYALYDAIRHDATTPLEAVAAAMIRCSLATGHGDTLESLLTEMEWQVERLQNRCAATPQTLCGMIAAIYGELDAEDCARIDREWARMRGYILPTDGTSTVSRPNGVTVAE